MYRIYISTFGRKTLHVKNGTAIEVGAENRSNFVYSLHDDIGDSISNENEYYGEMSGLYWVWKNAKIDDDDIIGFCHYNKALNISKRKATEWLLNNEKGFIVLSPIYAKIHEKHDEILGIGEALRNMGEGDYEIWDKLYDEKAASRFRNCYSCNMFITKGKSFKEYCSWVFGILGNMRSIVGDKPEVDPNLRRYCAFMGERLLSVYLMSRNIPVYCVNRRIKEWWLPIFYPCIQKVGMKKDSKIYRKLSKIFGSSSSYRLKQ